jgi:hypothetical protein
MEDLRYVMDNFPGGVFLEANPAIRYNLLLFKEKSKRIFTSIGARAIVFIRIFFVY